jgi:hypothetical protein
MSDACGANNVIAAAKPRIGPTTGPSAASGPEESP